MAQNQQRIRSGDPRANLELNHTYLSLPEPKRHPAPGLSSGGASPTPPGTHPTPARETQLHQAPHLGAPQNPGREPTQ